MVRLSPIELGIQMRLAYLSFLGWRRIPVIIHESKNFILESVHTRLNRFIGGSDYGMGYLGGILDKSHMFLPSHCVNDV